MPIPRKRTVSLDQALTRCEEWAKTARSGRIIPEKAENCLVDAADVFLRKQQSLYGWFLRQAQRVGESGLSMLVAFPLGKSGVGNMKSAEKDQLASSMKTRDYASNALEKLVEQYSTQSRHQLDQDQDQAESQEFMQHLPNYDVPRPEICQAGSLFRQAAKSLGTGKRTGCVYRLTALHILRMATEILTNYEACPGEILLTETSDTHSFVNIPILDSLCLYLWQDAEQII